MVNKVSFEAFVLALLIFAIGIGYGRVVVATPGTIVVSHGPGAIQEAINAASPRDVIKVTREHTMKT